MAMFYRNSNKMNQTRGVGRRRNEPTLAQRILENRKENQKSTSSYDPYTREDTSMDSGRGDSELQETPSPQLSERSSHWSELDFAHDDRSPTPQPTLPVRRGSSSKYRRVSPVPIEEEASRRKMNHKRSKTWSTDDTYDSEGESRDTRTSVEHKRRKEEVEKQRETDEQIFQKWWCAMVDRRRRVRKRHEPPNDGLTLAERIMLRRQAAQQCLSDDFDAVSHTDQPQDARPASGYIFYPAYATRRSYLADENNHRDEVTRDEYIEWNQPRSISQYSRQTDKSSRVVQTCDRDNRHTPSPVLECNETVVDRTDRRRASARSEGYIYIDNSRNARKYVPWSREERTAEDKVAAVHREYPQEKEVKKTVTVRDKKEIDESVEAILKDTEEDGTHKKEKRKEEKRNREEKKKRNIVKLETRSRSTDHVSNRQKEEQRPPSCYSDSVTTKTHVRKEEVRLKKDDRPKPREFLVEEQRTEDKIEKKKKEKYKDEKKEKLKKKTSEIVIEEEMPREENEEKAVVVAAAKTTDCAVLEDSKTSETKESKREIKKESKTDLKKESNKEEAKESKKKDKETKKDVKESRREDVKETKKDVKETKKEDVKESRKDVKRSKEDVKESKKDVKETKKDVKETKKDVKESKEDVKESKKDVKESKKDVKETKKEDVKESKKDVKESKKDVKETKKDAQESKKEVKETKKEDVKDSKKEESTDSNINISMAAAGIVAGIAKEDTSSKSETEEKSNARDESSSDNKSDESEEKNSKENKEETSSEESKSEFPLPVPDMPTGEDSEDEKDENESSKDTENEERDIFDDIASVSSDVPGPEQDPGDTKEQAEAAEDKADDSASLDEQIASVLDKIGRAHV